MLECSLSTPWILRPQTSTDSVCSFWPSPIHERRGKNLWHPGEIKREDGYMDELSSYTRASFLYPSACRLTSSHRSICWHFWQMKIQNDYGIERYWNISCVTLWEIFGHRIVTCTFQAFPVKGVHIYIIARREVQYGPHGNKERVFNFFFSTILLWKLLLRWILIKDVQFKSGVRVCVSRNGLLFRFNISR